MPGNPLPCAAVINGTGGSDNLMGTNANDQINGMAGNDVINGGGGAFDTITGGHLGFDTLTGGAGPDVFRYNSIAEAAVSQSGPKETITDFDYTQDALSFSITREWCL